MSLVRGIHPDANTGADTVNREILHLTLDTQPFGCMFVS